jgi:uncharacterized protein (TIGR03000 family)
MAPAGAALVAALGLLLMPDTAAAQRYGMYYGYPGGYYGGLGPGYYGRPWGYGWGWPGYYGSSFAYPYSYGYSAYTPYYSYTPYTAPSTTYYPYTASSLFSAPGTRPNAGSAGVGPTDTAGHLVVRVPKRDAEIRINGKRMTQTGTTRRFVSSRIPPGRKRTYKVTASWTDHGKEVQRSETVVLRAGQRKTVRFQEPKQAASDRNQGDRKKPARTDRKGNPSGKQTGRKKAAEQDQDEDSDQGE